jgi:hypothetical protein
MSNYNPQTRITWNNETLLQEFTLQGVSIRTGRRNVLEQPQPSYATIELWSTESQIPIDLTNTCLIEVNDTASGYTPLFVGVVSDVQIELAQFAFDSVTSTSQAIFRFRVTCIGSLGQLNRRTAGKNGYAKELDGVRVENILTEAFADQWDDMNATYQWNTYPSSQTWNDLFGVGFIHEVDTGQYELYAYAAAEDNALMLAQTAARSGRGVLWEHNDGSIHYDDYAARALKTEINLSDGDVLWQGLRVDSQWGDITNDLTITYKANAENNGQSIVLYGQLQSSIDTWLENSADVDLQIADYLVSRAYPRQYLTEHIVPLHNPEMGDALRVQLLEIENGQPLTTTYTMGRDAVTRFFVEGWDWDLNKEQAELTIYTSAYSETYQSLTWLQEPFATTWATYTPTTETWGDL